MPGTALFRLNIEHVTAITGAGDFKHRPRGGEGLFLFLSDELILSGSRND
jgi:hypothetical protein